MCLPEREASRFLPLNKGYKDGAGNPPNPNGLKTDCLWKEILEPRSLTNILESYAQIVEKSDEKTGKKQREQVFPRYHQLDVVRKLLADTAEHGAGKRYLIQHSAGSGKSYSIAWLAHQLIGLRTDGCDAFDSIIVVTDRRVLDKRIRDTVKQYAQVRSRKPCRQNQKQAGVNGFCKVLQMIGRIPSREGIQHHKLAHGLHSNIQATALHQKPCG